jgi:hypothetical protein
VTRVGLVCSVTPVGSIVSTSRPIFSMPKDRTPEEHCRRRLGIISWMCDSSYVCIRLESSIKLQSTLVISRTQSLISTSDDFMLFVWAHRPSMSVCDRLQAEPGCRPMLASAVEVFLTEVILKTFERGRYAGSSGGSSICFGGWTLAIPAFDRKSK